MSITLGKPNLARVRKDGFRAYDLHFHSKYSDTFTKVSSILKMADKLGIGVSITDHNMIKGVALATKAKSTVPVVPGIEVSCFEGAHILFYFSRMSELTEFYLKYVKDYTERSPYSTTKLLLDELLDRAAEYDSIAVAAHPYSPNSWGLAKTVQHRYVVKEIFDKLGAIEVINGTQSKKVNMRAIKLADELSKPYTGGSDGHTLSALGTVVTVTDSQTVSGLLDSIRKKQNAVIGSRQSFTMGSASVVKSLTKHLAYALPTMRLKARRMKDMSIKGRMVPAVRRSVDRIRKR